MSPSVRIVTARTTFTRRICPVSRTSTRNVPDTCKGCHEDFDLMQKFELDTEQADTYTSSFHGVALKFGEVAVANCASCHGTHTIRTHDDPKSSIYPDNIPKTCGKCHKGANENFAKGQIHLDPSRKESGLVYYISNFFIWLTSLTMIALFHPYFPRPPSTTQGTQRAHGKEGECVMKTEN